jgi:hypothetical protein
MAGRNVRERKIEKKDSKKMSREKRDGWIKASGPNE